MDNTKSRKSLEDLADVFFNKSRRNSFYKKELFLISAMTCSILLLLFYQNGWNLKTSFISSFVVLVIVGLKLLQIFNDRIKNYNHFVNEVESEIEISEWAISNLTMVADKLVKTKDSSSKEYLSLLKYITNAYEKKEGERFGKWVKKLKYTTDIEEFVDDFKDENQLSLSFELPLVTPNDGGREGENIIMFDLTEDVPDIEVKDSIEVIPILEYNKEGETRYSLDDYLDLENQLKNVNSGAEEYEPEIVEKELVFEKRKVSTTKIDPPESPLEELLKERKAERQRKLKDFNFKFQNSLSNIDEIEKEPAYKRQRVDLTPEKRQDLVQFFDSILTSYIQSNHEIGLIDHLLYYSAKPDLRL